MNERAELARAIEDYTVIAKGMGLTVPDIEFEIVPADVLYERASYHFPVRFPHWSHGSDYFRQKTMYDHGLSRIYELVVNTRPALAFLLDTNSLVANKLVIAHVLGHCHVFTHNVWFRYTNRDMHRTSRAHAEMVEAYEQEHGRDAVEHILDAALCISLHVDPSNMRRKSESEYDQERLHPTDPPRSQYDDLWNLKGTHERPQIQPKKIPAEPERDILGFIAQYGRYLEQWQRDLLEMVREEYQYLHANIRTKVTNEGWASYIHEKILERADLTPDEHIEFRLLHAGVIASEPRFGINPYGVGYRIFKDIERRWDEGAVETTWYGEDRRLPSGQGLDKVLQVAAEYRDSDFVRAFLTEQLVEDLDLYGFALQKIGSEQAWIVQQRDWRAVRDILAHELEGHGVPSIVVEDGDYRSRGILRLRHDHESDGKDIDWNYAKRVMGHLHTLWGRPVELVTEESGKRIEGVYDAEGWHGR